MKILLVQDWLRSGGTERQSVLLANAFAAAGHPTGLLTFRPGGVLANGIDQAVRRESLQPFDLHADWLAPGLKRKVKRIDPDVVLCMGRMANCYAGSIQHAMPRSAVISTMRTGKPLPVLFQRSLHRVRHVIANSRESAQTLTANFGVQAERITVIYNSLVFPPVSSLVRDEKLRREQGADSGTTVLLCVAMFRPEKNQRELIELASTLPPSPPWQLWLVGDGPARSECQRIVRERGLSDRVKFLGFERDPGRCYRAADIAVHASRSESLSNFLIEAQAHGLPAVVYAAQGIGECFIPGQTGWVAPEGDRVSFRAHLQRLLANPALRQSCAAPAQAYARENFDSPRQVHAYLDLFSRLTEARRT